MNLREWVGRNVETGDILHPAEKSLCEACARWLLEEARKWCQQDHERKISRNSGIEFIFTKGESLDAEDLLAHLTALVEGAK